MLKITLFAAAAVLSLSVSAWAAEGHGDPFPGPDDGVAKAVNNPKYTMGADAPFNYFNTDTPTPMTNYQQKPADADNPYPFTMPGQSVQLAPAPAPAPTSSSYAHSGTPGTHG